MQSRRLTFLVLASATTALGFSTLIGAAPKPRKHQTPASPASSPALIAQGKAVYGALDCNTCHVVNAAGTPVGPELSHIGLTWTQKKLKTMVRHPRQISPRGYMPAYAKTKISSVQLSQLVAYLGSLK